MDPLFGIPVGLALSAAAGLRVFVPLLMTGVAARLGALPLAPGMAWIGSDVALVAFATATVVEVCAYYIPWLDNLLDAIATPVAVTAGVMLTAAATPVIRRGTNTRNPAAALSANPTGIPKSGSTLRHSSCGSMKRFRFPPEG